MRFNKLDLNLLVALDTLLDEPNITRAAERMAMSQSAMSNALGRLRDYFGDELLVQVGRRMDELCIVGPAWASRSRLCPSIAAPMVKSISGAPLQPSPRIDS